MRIVASHLGRSKVVLDEQYFEPGEDFREAILRGLRESALFVFFASRKSLASTWCAFEIDEAQRLLIQGEIKKHLVLIIEKGVKYSDLPDWMQSAKVVLQPRPAQAARTVLHSLLAVLDISSARPFVGRSKTTDTLVKRLSQPTVPHILVLSGLDGIGRRSVLSNFVPSNLGLVAGPVAVMEETSELQDLYLWVLNETGDLGTRANLAAEMSAFATLPPDRQVDEVVARLTILCDDGNLPIIIDNGSLLDDAGTYKPEYQDLASRFLAPERDRYLAFVHRRTPYLTPLPFSHEVHVERVQPLEPSETQLLLQQLLRKISVDVDREQLRELTAAADGYPPAAYFIASFIEQYGVSALIADKSLLVDFKSGRFTAFLSKLNLSDEQWFVLQYLSWEATLPLVGIAVACNMEQDEAAVILRSLVDHSLVVVVDDRFSVSPPIRDAVGRVRGFLPVSVYLDIRQRLTTSFWQDQGPSIEIVDATLHAVARSGGGLLAEYDDLVRPSIVHRLAQESYRKKEWSQALEYGLRAEEMSLSRQDLRAVIFKALVQLERWDEAEPRLRDMQERGDRQAPYLRGFLLRKQRKHVEAARAFKLAIESGDNSLSVYRDYADTLYRCGRLDEALEYIKKVRDRDAENVWVLDLFILIAIDMDLDELTGSLLKDLDRYDIDKRFVHHRRASYYAKKRHYDIALDEAEEACGTGYSQFSAFATKADILIELERYDDAGRVLDDIKDRFRSHSKDVQSGLRGKLLVRQGRWVEAKAAWEQISNKSGPQAQMLRLRILEVKASDPTVSLSERQEALQSAEVLRGTLHMEMEPIALDDVESEDFDVG